MQWKLVKKMRRNKQNMTISSGFVWKMKWDTGQPVRSVLCPRDQTTKSYRWKWANEKKMQWNYVWLRQAMIDDGTKCNELCMTYWFFFLHEQWRFKNTLAKNADQFGLVLFNLPRPKWSVAIQFVIHFFWRLIFFCFVTFSLFWIDAKRNVSYGFVFEFVKQQEEYVSRRKWLCVCVCW